MTDEIILSTGIGLVTKTKEDIRKIIMPLACPDNPQEQEEYGEFAYYLKAFCKLSYQLVAWLWIDGPITQIEGEMDLKQQFQRALEEQAKKQDSQGSETIKRFLIGAEPRSSALTLPQFYAQMTKDPCYYGLEELKELHILKLKVEVVKEGYDGRLKYNNSTKEFIAELHFPPKPVEVSDGDLRIWVKDTTYEYLPNPPLPQDHYVSCF